MKFAGPDACQWVQARTQMDVNLDYELSQRLGLLLNVGDVFNEARNRFHIYGSETPGYARANTLNYLGTLITFGVKGTY